MQSKKDSQNQYRTGVLIANHVEDRCGADLISHQPDWQFPKSEVQANYDVGKSMFHAGRENYAAKPTTEDEINAEVGYKELEHKVLNNKIGQPTHILMGHGATQDNFTKRDFGTTNELFYEKKMKTETLINPHFYHDQKDKKDFFVTNARVEDQPTLFKPLAKNEMKTKAYADSTKTFDATFTKVGFRK